MKFKKGGIPWNKGVHYNSVKIGEMFNCIICKKEAPRTISNRKFCKECYRIKSNKDSLLRAKLYKKEKNARLQALRKVPITKNCEQCDSKENLQRHHPDYNKPLQVIILCAKCHYRVTINEKKAKIVHLGRENDS